VTRDLTTNPEQCPEHEVRLVGGSCPLAVCDYVQDRENNEDGGGGDRDDQDDQDETHEQGDG